MITSFQESAIIKEIQSEKDFGLNELYSVFGLCTCERRWDGRECTGKMSRFVLS